MFWLVILFIHNVLFIQASCIQPEISYEITVLRLQNEESLEVKEILHKLPTWFNPTFLPEAEINYLPLLKSVEIDRRTNSIALLGTHEDIERVEHFIFLYDDYAQKINRTICNLTSTPWSHEESEYCRSFILHSIKKAWLELEINRALEQIILEFWRLKSNYALININSDTGSNLITTLHERIVNLALYYNKVMPDYNDLINRLSDYPQSQQVITAMAQSVAEILQKTVLENNVAITQLISAYHVMCKDVSQAMHALCGTFKAILDNKYPFECKSIEEEEVAKVDLYQHLKPMIEQQITTILETQKKSETINQLYYNGLDIFFIYYIAMNTTPA